MSKNKLKFLTDDFCNLVNLKHLDLYNNQLENLPVQFGKLSKLRYLDLKGNPLQPTLLKIVGPCLTLKDCNEAAKRIVPFMVDLEVEFRAEQEKREAEEQQRKEEEELQLRELARLAKKAARKERVTKERQEKAQAENGEIKELETVVGEAKIVRSETKKSDESYKPLQKSSPSASPSSNFLSFLKTFVSVMFLFAFVFFCIMKFLPDQSENVIVALPKSQQYFLRNTYKTLDGLVSKAFKKVLNLYKM